MNIKASPNLDVPRGEHDRETLPGNPTAEIGTMAALEAFANRQRRRLK
jgi:hypothetical protein